MSHLTSLRILSRSRRIQSSQGLCHHWVCDAHTIHLFLSLLLSSHDRWLFCFSVLDHELCVCWGEARTAGVHVHRQHTLLIGCVQSTGQPALPVLVFILLSIGISVRSLCPVCYASAAQPRVSESVLSLARFRSQQRLVLYGRIGT